MTLRSHHHVLALCTLVVTAGFVACGTSAAVATPTPTSGFDAAVPPNDAGPLDSTTPAIDAGADAAPPQSPEMRALVEIEDQRLVGDARLLAYMRSTDPGLQRRAIEVAGRNVDPAALADILARVVDGATPELRATAVWATYDFDKAAVRTALLSRLPSESNSKVIAQIFYVLSKVATAGIVPVIESTLARDSSPEVLRAICFAIPRMIDAAAIAPTEVVSEAAFAKFWNALSDTTLTADIRNQAAKTVRYLVNGGARASLMTPVRADQLTNRYSDFRDEEVRLHLASKLRNLGTPASLVTMRAVFTSDPAPGVRAGMAYKFTEEQLKAPEVLRDFITVITGTNIEAAINAMRMLGYYPPADMTTHKPALIAAYEASSSAWYKAELLTMLHWADPTGAERREDFAFTGTQDVLQASAMRLVAAREDGSRYGAILYETANDTSLPRMIAAHEAIGRLIPASVLNVAEAKTTLRASLASGKEARIRAAIDAAGAREWDDLMPEMIASCTGQPYYMRVSVLKLAEKFKRPADLAWVDSFIEADEPWVGRAAAAAHLAIKGDDVSARVRKSLKVRVATPTDAEIAIAQNAKIEFTTTRGTYIMTPLPYAPVAVRRLYESVQKGEYNGLRVYRHEPGQLYQFGSLTYFDTGNTASMYPRTVKSSAFANTKGTIGNGRQADADDEGSTLFVNVFANEWIDLDYTPIGEITTGLDVALRTEIGDTIVSARILP